MDGKKPEIEFEHDDFDFETLDDELRVDDLCRNLLRQFYTYLQQQLGLTPAKASELAYSADYYVRDYLLDFLRSNILRPEPSQLRRFAGNWYIVKNLEPEYSVLERHLMAVGAFYGFLAASGMITQEDLLSVESELSDRDYYRARIESFLKIKGEGLEAWDSDCPLLPSKHL